MPFDDQQYKLKIGDEIIERIGLGCKEKYFKFVGVSKMGFSIRPHMC